MSEPCVDASLAIKWVLKGERWRRKARQFLVDALAAGVTLIAPPLFEYETESVLQAYLHTSVLTVAETDTALARIAVVGVQIVSHPEMVKRARGIARQCGQSRIFDSVYAARAALRSCEFWTADWAFFDAVRGTLPFVRHLSNYP
jgi:predicted nucleic acid-binding protein